MKNEWADPQGYAQRPSPVRYRIRNSRGEVVTRETSVARDAIRERFFHSLHPEDQLFADELVTLVQQACAYFYALDDSYRPLDGVADIRVSDEEVAARIERLERGENMREAERTMKQYYPLTSLPFDQQRALVEQIEALKQRWQFELLGEVENKVGTGTASG